MAASQHMLILGSAHYTIFVSTIVYGKPSKRGGVSNEAKLFIEFKYGHVLELSLAHLSPAPAFSSKKITEF